MIQVIATDLDGTLFYPKSRFAMIPKKNRRFLRRFISGGGRLVMVTSRSAEFASRMEEYFDLPFDFIGADGGFLKIDGKLVECNCFAPATVRSLVMEIKEAFSPMIFFLSSKDRPLVMPKHGISPLVWLGYQLYTASEGCYRERAVRSDHVFFNEIEKGEVTKLMVLIGISKKAKAMAELLSKKLAAAYPDVEVHWINQVIEITPKGCSKASGVVKYLDYLAIPHDNVVVVGDSGNDVTMFDAFHEHSFCMKHAPKTVRCHAKTTIARFHDLAKALYPSEDSKAKSQTTSKKEG